MQNIKLGQIDPETVSFEIMHFIVKKVQEVNKTGCIIGLSGGIDSAVTATLANKAFKEFNPELKVLGLILPSDINKDTEEAIILAKHLNIQYQVQDISAIVSEYKKYNKKAFNDPKAKGNLTARIRANILSTSAETENKSVCGTANKDEDYCLGYYTLFGDGAVHFSPLGNLSKRFVLQLGQHLNLNTQKTPSAGLEPGQTDFGDLGYSYLTAETVVEGKDQGFSTGELKKHPQVLELAEKDIKDYQKEFGKRKCNNTTEIVDDILQRHKMAMKKREILNPPAAEVSVEYR